jgi:hypothetical protein
VLQSLLSASVRLVFDVRGQLVYCGLKGAVVMYKKEPEPVPSTANPDGTLNVLVEFRADVNASPVQATRALLGGCQLDESYDPVPMSGGTTIVRCRVRTHADIEELKRQPGVVAVWTDTPIAPMTPR